MLVGDALVPGAPSSSTSSTSTAPLPAFTFSTYDADVPLIVAFVPDAYVHVPHVSPPKRLTPVVTVI